MEFAATTLYDFWKLEDHTLVKKSKKVEMPRFPMDMNSEELKLISAFDFSRD